MAKTEASLCFAPGKICLYSFTGRMTHRIPTYNGGKGFSEVCNLQQILLVLSLWSWSPLKPEGSQFLNFHRLEFWMSMEANKYHVVQGISGDCYTMQHWTCCPNNLPMLLQTEYGPKCSAASISVCQVTHQSSTSLLFASYYFRTSHKMVSSAVHPN